MTERHLRTYGGKTVHRGVVDRTNFVRLACQPRTHQLKSKYRTVNREPVTCAKCAAAS